MIFRPRLRALLRGAKTRALLLLALAAVALAAQQSGLLQQQYAGTLGDSRIGLTLLRDGDQIRGAHYFYQQSLQDIPLTVSRDEHGLTLREPGGAIFHLHFVGNRNRPVAFADSTGLQGTWSRGSSGSSADGSHTYPVSVHSLFLRSATEPPYAQVTAESPAAFERRVQTLFRAVLTGDKATAVRWISYPLAVNLPSGARRMLTTPAQVLAAWNQLFTPAMMARWKEDLPHEMFVHQGLAMLGGGEAWFDANGLAALNVPAPRLIHPAQKAASSPATHRHTTSH
jgi:hypothetical protein